MDSSFITLKPIGIVHTSASIEEIKNSYDGVEGIIEIFPEYEQGLYGIEEFSHIIIVAYLHKVTDEQRKVLKVRHRRLARFGIRIDDLPEVGVFCTDSPHRPNPIALSIVELLERNGRFLKVKGLDLFDGTPVLDIKAYTPDRCISEPRTPWWYKELEKRVAEKFGNVKWV
ncbi:MAG: tRNA (N6-threonylcarbamoyladenosine(37)-N6)-methyltransferase TrmO [Staphylothermus sp.]|nr:tRNA (N6-threonylcarbamoyladenosine(37)-N6)-methyltransferase TrmO [Staphylothermus sp.]